MPDPAPPSGPRHTRTIGSRAGHIAGTPPLHWATILRLLLYTDLHDAYRLNPHERHGKRDKRRAAIQPDVGPTNLIWLQSQIVLRMAALAGICMHGFALPYRCTKASCTIKIETQVCWPPAPEVVAAAHVQQNLTALRNGPTTHHRWQLAPHKFRNEAHPRCTQAHPFGDSKGWNCPGCWGNGMAASGPLQSRRRHSGPLVRTAAAACCNQRRWVKNVTGMDCEAEGIHRTTSGAPRQMCLATPSGPRPFLRKMIPNHAARWGSTDQRAQ